MLAFLEHLRFGGIEIFRFAPIQAATSEADHTALTVADGHHHAMTETVIKTVAAFARNHQTRCFQKFRSESLHLLQVLQQTVPLIWCIAKFELFKRGFVQAACFTQIAKRICTS